VSDMKATGRDVDMDIGQDISAQARQRKRNLNLEMECIKRFDSNTKRILHCREFGKGKELILGTSDDYCLVGRWHERLC